MPQSSPRGRRVTGGESVELRVRSYIDDTPEEYEFLLAGGPLDHLDEAVTLPLIALGHAAMAWARLEKHIDILLIHINKIQHSAELLGLYDPNHPRPFVGKLKLLKRYFNRHPALASHTGAIRRITSSLKEVAKERNAYLHTIFQAYDQQQKILTLRTVEFKGNDNFRFSEQKVSLEYIIKFTRDSVELNRALAEVSKEVFTSEMLGRLRGSG